MTTALDITTLLQEAFSTKRPIRFRYSGSDYFTARVEQIGSTWVEVYAYDSSSGKYSERWLKIDLIRDAEWSPTESIAFAKPPSTPPTPNWNMIPVEALLSASR